VKKRNNYIEGLEKQAIIVLAYLFKSIRYLFRLGYKLLRLIYRLIKKGLKLLYIKLEPFYSKLIEKIYSLACKTFDVN